MRTKINLSSFTGIRYCLSNKRVTKIEFGTAKVKLLLGMYLTVWFRSLWIWFVGEIWEDLEKSDGEAALEC